METPLAIFVALIVLFYTQTDGFVQRDVVSFCTFKSAPIFALASIAFFGRPYLKHALRRRVAVGLAFGGLGDFLLSTGDFGFLPGALAFAVGHIFYIAFFGRFLRVVSLRVVVAAFAYALFLGHFVIVPLLADELATLLTILFYTSVIGAAVVVAGSLLVVGSTDGHDGRQFGALAAGYVAFFASDSLLLLTRFGLLPPADATILFSYYAAQYLIFHSAAALRVDAPQRSRVVAA